MRFWLAEPTGTRRTNHEPPATNHQSPVTSQRYNPAMRSEVRYCLTDDGVRLAYSITGNAPQVVIQVPNGVQGTLLYEAMESRARWVAALAERFTFVQYDARGSGLSQRDVDDISLDRAVRDIETIAERVQAPNFVLFGLLAGSEEAILYAARHPERVSHLVLWPPPELRDDRTRTLGRLVRADWPTFTENFAHIAFTWGQGAIAHEYAEIMQESVTPEMFARWWIERMPRDASGMYELEEEAGRVKAPVLSLQREGAPENPVVTRVLAALPDARLRIVPGDSFAPYVGDTSDIIRVITDFLGASPPSAAEPPTLPPAGGLRTVLWTDLVSHTEMMRRLGDERGRDVLREHERITRDVLARHGGAEIKSMGDGFMASFASVTAAIECAVALQRAFAEREGEPLQVRVGLNAGEPIEEGGDLFGAAVILAARIAAHAAGGEILIPEPVRHLASGKSFVFSDRGDFVPKGFDDAVRLYEVRWRP
jgi:class 3 adenylate cyclase/pimeloyl-ACP methyl ester carboxylesterase